MRRQLVLILVLSLFVLAGCAKKAVDLKAQGNSLGAGDDKARKFAIVLQAGTESHEGMARALHALLYSQELKDKGYDVVLIFDGAGTEWAEALRDPKNKLHNTYEKLEKAGVTEVVCDLCASAFKVKDKLQEENAPLTAEFEGHPSLAKWISQGYQVIVL